MILGIRHHGPGSARSVLQALERLQPDIVLVEGPADAQAALALADSPDMRPPVALLMYNPKDLQQASFFPMAEFSPEWQAIQYGFRQGIPVRLMDLPMSLAFNLPDSARRTAALFAGPDDDAHDPFRRIARLAGYADPERWWEALVERNRDDPGALFEAILELMQALRADQTVPETDETLIREAWMRQTIRGAQKDGFQRIAIVCGAWHGPALAHLTRFKTGADAALLRGLKKTRTEATWVPWSFDRLATQSGYNAGVSAPAWYQILFENNRESNRGQAASDWLSRAARLLRAHDLAASAANVVEAARLADTLATMRLTAVPGIDELREAAVSVLCGGETKLLELIDKELVVGDVLGAAPSGLPQPPLRADFDAQVKIARLERGTQEQLLKLDLREESHGRKSRLLHRLLLLDIPWGKIQDAGPGKHGSFHEHWQLKWLPDYEIRLLEAGTWGNTVEEAAVRRSSRKISTETNLAELTRLLGEALRADLPALVEPLVAQLQAAGARSRDVLLLAEAVLPLAEILRYGSARRLNLDAVRAVYDELLPRIFVQLPAACLHIDEEQAVDIQAKLLGINRALGILPDAENEARWAKTLTEITQLQGVAPLLAGLAMRLLFDKTLRTPEETAVALQYRLSAGQEPLAAAQWLEGFLHGSGLLLLHYPALWSLLDAWVGQLPPDLFQNMLPLLRRTFSRFAAPEREKMLDLARQTVSGGFQETTTSSTPEWDPGRVEQVQPLLRVLFGSSLRSE